MLYNGKQSHGSASATEEEMSKAKDVGEQKEYKTKGTQVPAKKGFLCMKGFLKRGRGGGGGPSGVPQADGTVVRPKDADTVFASELSGRLPLALD